MADDNELENETTEPEGAAPEGDQFELTDRELAIARGEDPDGLPAESPESAATDGNEEHSHSEPEGEQATEGSTATGKEAAAEPNSWVTDDLAELAEAYSMTREDLAQFSTKDQFLATAKMFDRAGLSKLTTQQAPAEPGKELAAEEAVKKSQKLDREAYVKSGYSEQELALVDAFNAEIDRREQLEKQLAEQTKHFDSWKQEREEAERQRSIESFHDAADTMEEWLFGRSLDKNGRVVVLSDDQNKNRAALHNAAHAVRQMFEQAIAGGQQITMPSERAILQRAKHMVFGSAIAERERADLQKSISDQSKRRRPAGTRPVRPVGGAKKPAAKSPEEMAVDVANDPDVVSAWEKLQEERGA